MKRALILALLAWIPSSVWAEGTPKSLAYEDAAKFALGGNPDLRTLRLQAESLNDQAKQALSPNNPSFSISKNDLDGIQLLGIGASTVYSIGYTLGFPGKALTQSASSRYLGDSSREAAFAKEVDILMALSNNYIALATDQAHYEFLKEQEKKDQELVDLLKHKYAAGQAAQVDLLNARVVVANDEYAILGNRNDYQLQQTQFLNLIKKPGSKDFLPLVPTEITIPELKYDYDALKELMMKNRHQLTSAHRVVESTEAALTNAELAPFPDFSLSASLNVYNAPSAEPLTNVARDYSLGISITVPIFFPFNELAGIHAAAANRDAAESQEESQRLQSLADLQSAFTNFTSATKSLHDSQNIVIPAAKASYDLSAKTYALGEADYFMLNDARKSWVQAVSDMLDRKMASAQAFNSIVQEVGCDFINREGPHGCKD